VIAREDRDIARPRDLEGRTVGIAGLPSDRPLLDTMVRGDGGDPSKVRTKVVGFSLAPALAAGTVDAIIGGYWNVEAVQVEAKGVPVTVLKVEEHGVPSYDELVVVTSDDFARDSPDVVRAFLDGLAQGQRWAVGNQAAAVDGLLAVNEDLDGEQVAEGVRLVAPLLVPSDGPVLELDVADWQAYATWMRQEGLLETPVDVAAAVTDEFIPTGN
jgi:putative hydroxymethylpyrimidine transport system substrate-binding protein